MTNTNFLKNFLKKETACGIILLFVMIIAMIIANSPLEPYYSLFLLTEIEVRVSDIAVDKPLLLWINDGLMGIFFFLVGLELKRELIEGELSDVKQIILPGIGAIGGMVVPAIIYVLFNADDPVALRGWAIPAATDIAFALGVLALLGKKVPISLKIFLTSLAIFDDVAAILIIAVFYTETISTDALLIVALCTVVLLSFNRMNFSSTKPYILVGIIMWVATLKSGVHATLAGVILAMFIPIRIANVEKSPLKSLEKDLHDLVAFFVLPVFAFANAGIALGNISLESVFHDVPLGIALGLFLGKQIGVFGLCFLAIKTGWVKLAKGMNLLNLYGVSVLCGIGFTMSLFIGSLAFGNPEETMLFDERIGILLGSIASGIVGYCILHYSLKSNTEKSVESEKLINNL